MSHVWLDVTTIYGWRRPAVGIVRVETECAAFALEQTEIQVRFCRFDSVDCRYIEVMTDEVRWILDRIRMKLPANLRANSLVSSSKTTEQHITALVLRWIGMLPQGWRYRAFNFAAKRKSAYQTSIRSYREARLAIREFFKPVNNSNQFMLAGTSQQPSAATIHTAPFASNDIYISLGLDWDQKDLPYLFSQKRRIGFKVLLFCYDIIPVKFPHLCVSDVASKFAKYFADVGWCADYVLCISECTRRDITRLLIDLGTPLPQMGVIKLGSDIKSLTQDETASDVAELLNRKFILFVSTIERRKNHETLYRAYTRLIDGGMMDLPLLVFVGMPGWGVNDLLADLRLDPRIQPYIRILNFVTDSDLARLYKNAYFTTFPSLYEGWGLPVAESLTYGKFCLASNVASIPEVGGALLEYIDPWDVPKWAERIKWFIDHEADLILKENQIKNEYKRVTWESSASSIFEAAIRLCGPWLKKS